MFSKRFVAASAVAVTSFATIAGEPPASLKVADPAAQVSPTTYTSVLSTYRRADDTSVSPDKVWKEANATVANEDMPGDAHGGQAPTAQDASGHAGHAMSAQSANSDAHVGHGAPIKQASQGGHAGHQMPTQAVTPAAPTGQHSPALHAGHEMAPPKSDPHAGHQMAPMTKPDAHDGHQMSQEKKPAEATRPAAASDAENQSHGQHQQHQEEGTKK